MDYTELYNSMTPAQQSTFSFCYAIIVVLSIIAMWKMFTKAGEAGWKAIIPIYNIYTLCKIVDGKGIKFLLFIIPVVNIIYSIIFDIRTAKAYGKGAGFGIGLIFLPTIFTLILGFGSAQYIGPRGER